MCNLIYVSVHKEIYGLRESQSNNIPWRIRPYNSLELEKELSARKAKAAKVKSEKVNK